MNTYVIYAILTDSKSGHILNVIKRAEVYTSADAVIIADMLEQRERELIEQGARVGDCFNTCYGWKIKQGKWQEQAAELLKIGQKEGLYCIR